MRRKRRLKLRWPKNAAESSSSEDDSFVYGGARNGPRTEERGSSCSLPQTNTRTREASVVRDVLQRQVYFQRAAQVLPKWAIESDLMTNFPTFHLISVASGSPVGVRRCSSDGHISLENRRGARNRPSTGDLNSGDSSGSEEVFVTSCDRDGNGNINLDKKMDPEEPPARNQVILECTETQGEVAVEKEEKEAIGSNDDDDDDDDDDEDDILALEDISSSTCSTPSILNRSDIAEGTDSVEELNDEEHISDEDDDDENNSTDDDVESSRKESESVDEINEVDSEVKRQKAYKPRKRLPVRNKPLESIANSILSNGHRPVVAQHSDSSTAMLLDLIRELESNMSGGSFDAGVPPQAFTVGCRISQSCDAFLATGEGVCLNMKRRRSRGRKLASRSMENVDVDCLDWRDKNRIGDMSDLLADVTRMFNKRHGKTQDSPEPSERETEAEFWRYIDSLNMNPLKDHRFRHSKSRRMFLSNPNLFTFAVSLSDLNPDEVDPDFVDEKPEFKSRFDGDADERIGLEIPVELLAGMSDCILPGSVTHQNMDSSSCLELALEGERLCQAGDCRAGVAFFEAAIQTGTDDLRTLSAIYSQLGNAYFHLGDYDKAMEYHKLDLTVARTMGDRLGVAKASGNLGNTLKVMGKYKEAIGCCERHLSISQELEDKVGEGRALYNLGNVYHSQSKHLSRIAPQEPEGLSEEVKHCLQKAVEYYAANLRLMEEINDRSAQGRACGNLGNTHYLLGNFSQAINYHYERLTLAKEFGDKAAERRAHSNLGNAYIFLGEFEKAAEHYKKTLQSAQELGERAVEAQACYSLGNTCTLLRDYQMAINYHLRHLAIAQELEDKVGEGKACWSLGNAYASTNNHNKALQFANRHLEISKAIGDKTGQAAAQMNLVDIRKVLGLPPTPAESESVETSEDLKPRARCRPKSMDDLDRHKASIDETNAEEDNFFELLSRFQSKRMDDQRCALSIDNNRNRSKPQLPQPPLPPQREAGSLSPTRCPNGTASPIGNGRGIELSAPRIPELNQDKSGALEELMESIAGMQGSRMDEQRATLPQLPGLNNQKAVLQRLSVQASDSTSPPDDNFFDMLMRCQGSRIEDQRTSLPKEKVKTHPAPTVPDDDFFSLIMRFQSGRLDDQRSAMPLAASRNSIRPTATDEEEPPGNLQIAEAKDSLISRIAKGRK